MRKKSPSQPQRSYNLRKCASNQLLKMDIIPQVVRQPHFVRKIKNQETKLARVNSLNTKKAKIPQMIRVESKSKKQMGNKNINDKQLKAEKYKYETASNNFNSPYKKQPYKLQPSFSDLKTNITENRANQILGDRYESESKISSSNKSVKFSTRLQDVSTVHNHRGRQQSRSPSILKKRNNGERNSVISNNMTERSFSINHSFRSNHKQLSKKIIEQSNTNIAIKKKYESILKSFQLKSKKYKPPLPGKKVPADQKYRDQIFPPVYSSIFPINQKLNPKKGQQIQWIRVCELFPKQNIILYEKPDDSSKYLDKSRQQILIKNISMVRQKGSYASQHMITALNSIKNSTTLLQKIFEDQQINPYGIYILKIFQQTSWKYIIIDDYVPVIRSNLVGSENTFRSAFTSIIQQRQQSASKSLRNKKKSEGAFPIWPLLLEKAYANYYSSYQATTFGTTIDMIQQFCGGPLQFISLSDKKDAEQYLQIIDNLLSEMKNGNVVSVCQLKETQPLIPLYYKAQYCYSMITEQELKYYDPLREYEATKIKFYDLGLICTHIYLYNPSKYTQEVSCTVSKPRHKVSQNLIKQIKNNYNSPRKSLKIQQSKDQKNQFIPRDIPSVRRFTLKQADLCSFFIRQRDNKFLYKIGVDYIWNRAILIAKQYDGGYRWIDGEYSNKKSICFTHNLQAGQYLLLLWPEWSKNKYHQEIHLTIESTQKIDKIQRIKLDPSEKALQTACTDLAQNKGRMNQINKFICSYYYLNPKVGMIIENINNQRLRGDVTVVRSISGLKSKVQIVPMNDQFFQDVKSKTNQEGAEYLAIKKDTIQVIIPEKSEFTVILKMRGGIDHKFFKAFAFGA